MAARNRKHLAQEGIRLGGGLLDFARIHAREAHKLKPMKKNISAIESFQAAFREELLEEEMETVPP